MSAAPALRYLGATMRPAIDASVTGLLACLLALGAGGALAVNLQVPKDTPLAQFDEEDVRLMKAAIDTALGPADLGKPVEWKNDATGSGGSVVASEAKRAGCRVLSIDNRHKATTRRSKVQFCRTNGEWKLAR